MSKLEMTIPSLRSDTAWDGFLIFIVVFFGFLGILNLVNHVAIIPSAIWLVFVTVTVWNGCREVGGLRRYLVDRCSFFAGRRFVLYPSGQTDSSRIRFGFEIFGRRVFQRDVQIERIESVEWAPGQATSMAGHDVNDWQVVLWFDHCNPEKSKRDHMLRKPNQDLLIVGPARRKEDTSSLGLEFVAFLLKSGARLTEGSNDSVFVRELSKENKKAENHPTKPSNSTSEPAT
jgi:hypothetical protein